MSVPGAPFEAPARLPDYQNEREIYPDHPASEGRVEELWVPTDTEVGQHRFQCVTPVEERSYLKRASFLDIEQLASSGMRRTFERFGFKSFHQSEQDTTTYGKPVTVEEAALTFPSSLDLRLRVSAFADGTTQRADKLTIAPVAPKKFSGLQQIGELAQGRLVMAVEEPERELNGRYSLSFFSHDERIHFPAWLCLPSAITSAICREAGVAMSNYNQGRQDKNWRMEDSALKRIGEMTGLIDDLVTVWTMGNLVAGNDIDYGQKMGDLLRWPSAGSYHRMTLRHIEKPAPDEVLVAKWR